MTRAATLAVLLGATACGSRSQLRVPSPRVDASEAPADTVAIDVTPVDVRPVDAISLDTGPVDANDACSPSPDAAPEQFVWHECEPICGTWTWDPSMRVFHAAWENGAVATLMLLEYDACRVVVERDDYAGSSSGLTARYDGTRTGRMVAGTVTWHGSAGDVHSGMWQASW